MTSDHKTTGQLWCTKDITSDSIREDGESPAICNDSMEGYVKIGLATIPADYPSKDIVQTVHDQGVTPAEVAGYEINLDTLEK